MSDRLRPWLLAIVACTLAIAAVAGFQGKVPSAGLTVQITSPLGRTGMEGPVRIVARITGQTSGETLSPVQFFVDGKLVGEDSDGPPYAVEWVDDNPFEPREIVVQVSDSRGRMARDTVTLKPLAVSSSVGVSSVLLEPLVVDAKGHPVNSLKADDFHVFEDDVPQKVDLSTPDTIPATYTLLVDSSQSMAHRMEFVREAARELPDHLRKDDDVVVVPFSVKPGAITGPTKDRNTIAGAIDAIPVGGGTAILDCLSLVAKKLGDIQGRHVLVLITDGYDENSTTTFDGAMAAVKSQQITLYVVGIGGIAGISIKGEDLLRRLAEETGGRAFFPSQEFQLTDIHGLIAADVQDRYLVSYTPSNQKADGTWRKIRLTTNDPTQKVQVRDGYQSEAPPPVQPRLEFTIRDEQREYLDMSADDIEVVEDGVPQKIEGFEEALSPVSIMLVLDASGSMRAGTAQVIAAARSFVNALPAKDSLGVIQFADKSALVQDLSTKRDGALDAIDQYHANGGTALYDALVDSLARLNHVDARRVVVVMTDGRDEDNPGTGPGSTHSLDDVLAAADETGATIYGIGLGTKVDRPVLERLAKITSGESYFPEDVSTLDANYRRVLENLRRRYVLSYSSTNSTRDGGWRKVQIKSKRPGVTIESKGGYFAPKADGGGGI